MDTACKLNHVFEIVIIHSSFSSSYLQKNDDYWRLEEALIRYFISSVMGNIPKEMTQVLLNPNEVSSMTFWRILQNIQNYHMYPYTNINKIFCL